MKFISIEEVKQIHDMLIEEFGGAKGIRSEELLDAAVHRMNASFDGKVATQKIALKKIAGFFKNHLKLS